MRKYLLDTHVVLWIAENSPKLSVVAKKVVIGHSNEKYVSIVSAWEVSIKLGTDKLRLDGGLPEFFRIVDLNGFEVLPIERRYLGRLAELPQIHKDPFDRLLVAMALSEGMTILTTDENIHKYDVNCVW